MAVIDFHSHILPGIDDGSKDVPTSLAMLESMSSQGVEVVVATPHFYAWRDRVDAFLQRRRSAWESLSASLTPDLPRICLGAEVAYFPGISGAEQVEALTIQGTNVLLLEMPFQPWSESNVEEVRTLLERKKLRIVIAHLERYYSLPGNRERIAQLLKLPVTVQLNAEGLLEWRQRGRIIRMFRSGQAQLLGSDCHGINHRKPNLGPGREVIRKKLGQERLDLIDEAGAQLLPEGILYA